MPVGDLEKFLAKRYLGRVAIISYVTVMMVLIQAFISYWLSCLYTVARQKRFEICIS